MGAKKKLKVPQSVVKSLPHIMQRTRVTNGLSLLPGVDGRCYWARRMRDIIGLHIADLGGSENCSEAEKSICRRVACLTIELERLERRFARADLDHVSYPDMDMYSRLANTLRRLLDMTGLQRRSRDITPTIDQYVAYHANDPDNTDEIEDDVVDILDSMQVSEAAE